MSKWEYLTVLLGVYSEYDKEDLSKYGEKGWELVSVITVRQENVYAYFKREKKTQN